MKNIHPNLLSVAPMMDRIDLHFRIYKINF